MDWNSSNARAALYSQLLREELAKLTPNCPGNRISGQQQAYAKGRAGRRFAALEMLGA